MYLKIEIEIIAKIIDIYSNIILFKEREGKEYEIKIVIIPKYWNN